MIRVQEINGKQYVSLATYKRLLNKCDRLEKEIKMLQNRIVEISEKYIEKDYKWK